MYALISQILGLLDRRDKLKGFLLLFTVFLVSIVDVLGIASIMPFIALLSDNESLHSSEIIVYLHKIMGEPNNNQFIKYVGLCVFFLLITALTLKAISHYMHLRYALFIECKISQRLMKSYLDQPYIWHLQENSAELMKTILDEVNSAVNVGLISLITLVAQSIGASFIIILIIIVDPMIALTVCLVLLCFYGLIYALVSSYLSGLGYRRAEANAERFLVSSEAFGAIKEVKFRGSEGYFLERYSGPAFKYARTQLTINSLSTLPRFVLESVGFGGMILLVLFLIDRYESLSQSLSLLALYAFAGYRILPALQQIYGSVTQLQSANASVEMVHKGLSSPSNSNRRRQAGGSRNCPPRIELKDINFSYPGEQRPALSDVNLVIPEGSVVAFVGESGAGKSTLIDVILGLLTPQHGSIFINNQKVDVRQEAYGFNLGYVPQNIYLSDDTIAANIAFGFPEEEIDLPRVKDAAKLANIDHFIEYELNFGYDTIIGERGARLSGGQRQRVGIARALYAGPMLFVMDEATSALDRVTEHAILDSISELRVRLTMLIIAHRLSTVKNANLIYVLEKGRIIEKGTFDELFDKSELFRKLASSNQLRD